jgi:hypothetical protein
MEIDRRERCQRGQRRLLVGDTQHLWGERR